MILALGNIPQYGALFEVHVLYFWINTWAVNARMTNELVYPIISVVSHRFIFNYFDTYTNVVLHYHFTSNHFSPYTISVSHIIFLHIQPFQPKHHSDVLYIISHTFISTQTLQWCHEKNTWPLRCADLLNRPSLYASGMLRTSPVEATWPATPLSIGNLAQERHSYIHNLDNGGETYSFTNWSLCHLIFINLFVPMCQNRFSIDIKYQRFTNKNCSSV